MPTWSRGLIVAVSARAGLGQVLSRPREQFQQKAIWPLDRPDAVPAEFIMPVDRHPQHGQIVIDDHARQARVGRPVWVVLAWRPSIEGARSPPASRLEGHGSGGPAPSSRHGHSRREFLRPYVRSPGPAHPVSNPPSNRQVHEAHRAEFGDLVCPLSFVRRMRPKRSISPNLAESASLSAIVDKPDRGRALADRGA